MIRSWAYNGCRVSCALAGKRVSLTSYPVDGANDAGLDHLSNLDAEREESGPNGLHEEDVLLSGSLDQLLGLGRRHSEGLLTEDILASLDGQHGVLEVVAVGSSDIDDVDVGVSDELGIGAVGLG